MLIESVCEGESEDCTPKKGDIDDVISGLQVKFNNGVYHKGKTSSLITSWNSTFFLSDLFTMTPLDL